MEHLREQGKARLAKATLGAVFTIGLLLILRIVVSVLPLFRTNVFAQYSPVTLDRLIMALLSFLVALSIVNYGFQVDISAKLMSRRFPAVGTLFRLLICGGAVVYAYFALRRVALDNMQGFESAYTTVFGVLMGLILLGIVVFLFRNGDVLAEAVLNAGHGPKPEPSGRVCSKCGKPALGESKFCRLCGGEVAEQSVPDTGRQCPSCHKTVDEDVKFCRNCGAEIPAQDAPASQPVCWSCKEPIDEQVRFCGSCGADQTADRPSVEPLREPPPPASKERVCSSCGKALSDQDRFCRGCGASVAVDGGASA